ncbi:MAG: hypothetical protein ABSD49_15350 [Candidatus Bathyarchaeia archaeon]
MKSSSQTRLSTANSSVKMLGSDESAAAKLSVMTGRIKDRSQDRFHATYVWRTRSSDAPPLISILGGGYVG